MSVKTIITEGFGSFGTISLVITQGYGSSLVPPTPPVVVPATGSGWERKRRGALPQYYRDIKIPDYQLITLPQDEIANAVAIDVLDKIGEIWSLLQESDRHFSAMLKQLDTISRQVATFIESRQIYQLVELVETRIRIEQDHAKAVADARDDEEHEEFMHLF